MMPDENASTEEVWYKQQNKRLLARVRNLEHLVAERPDISPVLAKRCIEDQGKPFNQALQTILGILTQHAVKVPVGKK